MELACKPTSARSSSILKEKFTVNQPISLFFEAPECCLEAQEPQHLDVNQVLINIDQPTFCFHQLALAAVVPFALRCTKFSHSHTYSTNNTWQCETAGLCVDLLQIISLLTCSTMQQPMSCVENFTGNIFAVCIVCREVGGLHVL